MSDSSRITLALLGLLQTDAPLLTLMPDNAWFAEAPAGRKKFVIVSLINSDDARDFGGRAFESALYTVEARELVLAGVGFSNVHAAFARFDELIERSRITIPGYRTMAQYRESYEETVEVDDNDSSIRWNRCGGHYRIVAQPQS